MAQFGGLRQSQMAMTQRAETAATLQAVTDEAAAEREAKEAARREARCSERRLVSLWQALELCREIHLLEQRVEALVRVGIFSG